MQAFVSDYMLFLNIISWLAFSALPSPLHGEVSSSFEPVFYPLLSRTRSRCRCWAASRLSHRPEPSGHAVHGEVDGLGIGGQHGLRFVLLRRTHRQQRRQYPICTDRSPVCPVLHELRGDRICWDGAQARRASRPASKFVDGSPRLAG